MTTEPITCTIDDAVRISGISRSRIYQLIENGKVTSTKVGNRRLDTQPIGQSSTISDRIGILGILKSKHCSDGC